MTAQLLEHLGGTRKSVTRLADGDVENELLDAQLTHGVGALVLGALGLVLCWCLYIEKKNMVALADALPLSYRTPLVDEQVTIFSGRVQS